MKGRLVIGGLTLLPIAFILFLVFGSEATNITYPVIASLSAVVFLLMTLLLFFYEWHVVQNPYLAKGTKPLWAAVIFLGGPVAQAVYFWLYLWRPRPAPAATA